MRLSSLGSTRATGPPLPPQPADANTMDPSPVICRGSEPPGFLGTLVGESADGRKGRRIEEVEEKEEEEGAGSPVEKQEGEKGKKGSVPSWDPRAPRESPLWVRQFSALGMLPRLKRHLKKQTNLEITFQKSTRVFTNQPPHPKKRKHNQLLIKMLKIKPNQYLHITFSTPSSPTSRGFCRNSDEWPCTEACRKLTLRTLLKTKTWSL